MAGTRPITASNSVLGPGDVRATTSASSVREVALAAMYKRKWFRSMQAPPSARMEKAEETIARTSVGPSRQQIPVALLAKEERCACRIRRRARLGSADGDKMRHCGYRGGGEEDRLGYRPAILACPPRASVTSAQEQAGAIWPASGPDCVCEMFTNHWNLARADRRIAQDRSIPQTRGHCVHGRKVALLPRLLMMKRQQDSTSRAVCPTRTGTSDRKSTACQPARA